MESINLPAVKLIINEVDFRFASTANKIAVIDTRRSSDQKLGERSIVVSICSQLPLHDEVAYATTTTTIVTTTTTAITTTSNNNNSYLPLPAIRAAIGASEATILRTATTITSAKQIDFTSQAESAVLDRIVIRSRDINGDSESSQLTPMDAFPAAQGTQTYLSYYFCLKHEDISL
ncbi:unnamed protein product [Thelazia callipaeda]|uniref:Uncharacterized protein n=1 Tax=Thelazia callipaeda TaxID=103827 RepID=A0A0N5CYY2_THECL|nr:unnamed protein product [Thelazia callipaeda]